MGIRHSLSKESIANNLKKLEKLRIKVSHGSILTLSALAIILLVAFVIRIFPIRWEIDPTLGTTTLHLSEFDPYFQYRFTEYLVNNGFISWNWPSPGWIDTMRWYPSGMAIARQGFPALPFTTAVLYQVITSLGVNIDLMSFCAFLPPIFATLACLAVYFLGKDFGGKSVGLLAALFLALNPSFLQRTSLGFFDGENIGILAIVIFLFLFLRSIDDSKPQSSSLKYAIGSGLALGYLCAGWGAAYYLIDVTTLFVFVLILLKRYSTRLLLSYGLTFGLALAIAINVPKLSITYLSTFPILVAVGVFAILCLYEISRALTSARSKVLFTIGFLVVLIGGFGVLWQFGYMQEIAGKFWSVVNPFARTTSPLVESVAEQRITAWGSIYYELGMPIIFCIASFFFILRKPSNSNLFLIILGLTSLYFASSMVRLLVLLAPVFGLLAAIGIIGMLKPFVTLFKEPPKIMAKKKYRMDYVGREFSGTAILLIFLLLTTSLAFSPQTGGIPKIYRQAYVPITVTAGSLPIAPSQPVREWLDILAYTRALGSATVVVSWWDYGYWLTVLGNVTTLSDNATINITNIENTGYVFMSNETQAIRLLNETYARPKYILVFTTIDSSGNWVGYGDEGKWVWMARISGKAYQRFLSKGFMTPQSAWTDSIEDAQKFGNQSLGMDGKDNNGDGDIEDEGEVTVNARGQNTTLFKLMAFGRNRWMFENGKLEANVTIPEPTYFKEAFIAGLTNDGSEYGGIVPLVCLYEVKYPS